MRKPITGRKVWRSLSRLVTLLMALTLAGPAAVLGAERISITYRDEPLTRVVEKLARESGFRIEVRGGENETLLSGAVEALSFEAALRKIFRNHNHTILWDLASQTVTVFIFPPSAPSVASGAVRARPASSPRDAIQPGLRRLAPGNRTGAGRLEADGSVMVITGDRTRFVESTRTMGR